MVFRFLIFTFLPYFVRSFIVDKEIEFMKEFARLAVVVAGGYRLISPSFCL